MPAELIDGSAVAARVRERVKRGVADRLGRGLPAPGLATILVGDDPASAIYVSRKQEACREVGITAFDHRLAADARPAEIAALIGRLNADQRVHGILLQLPLPEGVEAAPLIDLIDPAKDVDGLTTISQGRLLSGRPGLRPCTPRGVLELLDAYGVALEGREAVVVGRSQLVGKPLAQLLLERNATVTVCHSRTRSLAAVCARAEVLVAAAGVPRLIGREHVRPGAVVIDVGIHRLPEGLCGDVDQSAVRDKAALLTPVPGGVGPMTVAMLLENTLLAADGQSGAGSGGASSDRSGM